MRKNYGFGAYYVSRVPATTRILRRQTAECTVLHHYDTYTQTGHSTLYITDYIEMPNYQSSNTGAQDHEWSVAVRMLIKFQFNRIAEYIIILWSCFVSVLTAAAIGDSWNMFMIDNILERLMYSPSVAGKRSIQI